MGPREPDYAIECARRLPRRLPAQSISSVYTDPHHAISSSSSNGDLHQSAGLSLATINTLRSGSVHSPVRLVLLG
jgi:hypothetical protein